MNERAGNIMTREGDSGTVATVCCDYFFWKDDELPEGYYKNLIRTLKQQVESMEDLAELVNLRKRVVELEFLVSTENSVIDKLEKKVTNEKEVVMILNDKLDASMQ
ncbi:unnamed protein product [Lactuca virosa]|uniref:Uncharacterized protein n=1 Tax=Lactuca virosa TaxID=75947 RepID=A0AAU9N6D2_9ASTR|nr:unnamed protein product [Lactuca virosa]